MGDMWLANPSLSKQDLRLDEYEMFFKTVGQIFYFNVTGGEPYIRKDLPDIMELACKYLKPRIINIPTNGIMSRRIYEHTAKILDIINRYDNSISLTIHPSIDGVGEKHDEVRGVKGNFERLVKTINLLIPLQDNYSNFYLEPGSVISNFNIDSLNEIENFVHGLGVQSYRSEVAENRSEFQNFGDPITPSAEVYQRLIKEFSKKIESNIAEKKLLTKMTEAMRIIYYDIAWKILERQKQIIPCYAGNSNIHINFDGAVWPCSVLGYDYEMGNIRNYNYKFPELLMSEDAYKVRTYIQEQNCACPLAGVYYSNILFHFPSLFKAGLKFIDFALRRNSKTHI
jgi:MoaA/NifB/PqqE/SkfB family radical SAM enzyme